ncbi:hypothetical protein OAH07_03815 [Verrucomicrobia bacterium]|nr:hypothetical protein [Verrucomicrobiota bacterium]
MSRLLWGIEKPAYVFPISKTKRTLPGLFASSSHSGLEIPNGARLLSDHRSEPFSPATRDVESFPTGLSACFQSQWVGFFQAWPLKLQALK